MSLSTDETYDIARVRAAFPVLSEVNYLNIGTYGIMPEPAYQTFAGLLADFERKGVASTVNVGAKANETRERIAKLLGASTLEIAFTRDATDGINLVLAGLNWQPGDEVITTTEEHEAMNHPLLYLQATKHIVVKRGGSLAGPAGDAQAHRGAGNATHAPDRHEPRDVRDGHAPAGEGNLRLGGGAQRRFALRWRTGGRGIPGERARHWLRLLRVQRAQMAVRAQGHRHLLRQAGQDGAAEPCPRGRRITRLGGYAHRRGGSQRLRGCASSMARVPGLCMPASAPASIGTIASVGRMCIAISPG